MLGNYLLLPVFFFLLLFATVFLFISRKNFLDNKIFKIFGLYLSTVFVYSLLILLHKANLVYYISQLNIFNFSLFLLFVAFFSKVLFLKQVVFANRYKLLFAGYIFLLVFITIYSSINNSLNVNFYIVFIVFSEIVLISKLIFKINSKNTTDKLALLNLLVSIFVVNSLHLFVIIIDLENIFNLVNIHFLILSLEMFSYSYYLYLQDDNKFLKNYKHKLLIIVLLLVFIPLTIRAIYIYNRVSAMLVSSAVTSIEAKNKIIGIKIQEATSQYSRDVLMFTKTFDETFNEEDSKNKNRIINLFLNYAKSNKEVTQLRFLDLEGQEVIRVNQEYGFQQITPVPELQFKGNRDYFIKSQNIGYEEVYVSDINLNREGANQNIEFPFNPVIRFSSNVYIGNKKIGTVILNISTDILFNDIFEENNDYEIYIISEDGHYILHPDKEKMWGGQDNLNTSISASKEMSNLWEAILLNDNTHLFGKAEAKKDSLFVFSKIALNPLDENSKTIYLVFEQLSNVFYTEIDKLANIIIFSSMILGIIIFVLINIIVNKLVRPLILLKNAVSNYSSLNIDDFKIKSSDEIEWLSMSFVRLLKDVRSSQEKVSKKVSEQTEEITVNAERLEKQRMAMVNLIEDIDLEKKITEQHLEDLEKFKLAIDNVSELIFITDPVGVVLYSNPAVYKVTGFTQEEVLGKKAGKKWGGLMSQEWITEFWNTIAVKKQKYSGMITNKRKNGNEFISDISVHPLLDDNQEVEFFVCVQRDITKEIEVDKMKTDFISLASHQLRTPLSAMRWFLEMLTEGDLGKLNVQQSEVVENISISNQRMISLVNALLNISRIESGRIIINPTKTNMVVLVNEVYSSIEKLFSLKNQKVSFKTEEDSIVLNIDVDLISQVILNLLTNANKYTPKNGKIDVSIYRSNNFVIFKVSDSGLGIPASEQEHIFKRFYRAKNTVKVDTDGTGLGLYLAKTIILSSGGEIWFESKEDVGTTFWFSIPEKGMQKNEGEVSLTVSN